MRRIVFAGVALATVVALTGCSDSASSPDGGSSGGQKTLGVVALVATDALNAAVIEGAKQQAAEEGWKVVVTDTQGSVDKANAAMTTFSTTQKVDAMAVMAFPTAQLGSGLASAASANIPVVSWGGELTNNVKATTSAEQVGKDSVDSMLKDFGDSGDVLALTYHTGVLCLYRGIAFDAAMKSESGIKVTSNEVAIPGQVQDGTKFTSAWLASHPAGSGKLAIWGAWDEPAMGAIAALKQANRTDVEVFAINGGPQALQAVKDGSMTQVVWQDGKTEGVELMKAASQSLEDGSSWKPKTINVPGVVVTKDNIDDFLADHPDALNS